MASRTLENSPGAMPCPFGPITSAAVTVPVTVPPRAGQVRGECEGLELSQKKIITPPATFFWPRWMWANSESATRPEYFSSNVMESPLTVARNEPEAGVEFAGVSLKPFSVARSLLRDSSSALTATTKAAMQIARTAATVRHFVFMFRSPCFVLLRLLGPGQSLVIEVVPRVGKRKGVQFVITDARRDTAVTGSQEGKSIDYGRSVDNRVTTRE